MIVTSHQPTYLPGVSVLAKIAAADVVIWLDRVRFTMPGWLNRNALPDGTWLTVPVSRPHRRSPVRDALIEGDEWKHDHARTLVEHYGDAAHFDPILVNRISIPGSWDGEQLIWLNDQVTDRLLELAGIEVERRWQSDYAALGPSLSDTIARMVKDSGGDTYLASPQEAERLDRATFARRGVELQLFTFAGENPSAVDPLMRHGSISTDATQAVVSA